MSFNFEAPVTWSACIWVSITLTSFKLSSFNKFTYLFTFSITGPITDSEPGIQPTGTYSFTNLVEGSYVIRIEDAGYVSDSQSGNCYATDTVELIAPEPITINIEFATMEQVAYVKQRCPDDYTVMGNQYYCDWKIVDHELYVKGPTCVYDDWFATGDIVALDMGRRMYYLGRK